MEKFTCRTCLKTNLTKNTTVYISNKAEVTDMPFKDMLEIFIPEMDLDVSEGATVMCLSCSQLLQSAYTFKKMCLKTEEKINGYLYQNNIELGKKINLREILSGKKRDANDLEYKSKSKILSECKSTQENGSDRYKNSLECDAQMHVSDSGTDTEGKEAMKSQRTRKRTNVRKKKKIYDYSSLKRSYTCDLCEYKAYRLDLLDSHKLKHDANLLTVKEFKCDLCMYSTPRKRALDRHLFTHKGKSQHSCEVCRKTFAEKYQLKLHSITHTGEELPHKCEECGKGYLTRSYLKQHMETSHLVKRKNCCSERSEEKCEHSFSRFYKCDMCESSFSDRRGLDAHKFSHTGGEFPFKCLHCDFSTAWKGNLKKHLQNKH